MMIDGLNLVIINAIIKACSNYIGVGSQLHEFRFAILVYLEPNPRIGCTSSDIS